LAIDDFVNQAKWSIRLNKAREEGYLLLRLSN
jgi:hypothetical protein